MKKCPKCEAQHDKPGVYCSRKCANSKKFTKEANKKKGEGVKKYWNSLTDVEKKTKRKKTKTLRQGISILKLMEEDWDVLSYDSKRKRIIIEQNGKCNNCHLEKWQDVYISLEIDHMDGNKENNQRGNLEALCPNCHSLTPTWRGKKISKEKNSVSIVTLRIKEDQFLYEQLINNASIV